MTASELWFDWDIDTWPLLMALLVAMSCGLLGTVFLGAVHTRNSGARIRPETWR